MPLLLSHKSAFAVRSLLLTYPVSRKERLDLQLSGESNMSLSSGSGGRCDRKRVIEGLNNGTPLVPQRRMPTELDTFRHSLPAYERQDEIMQLIRDNRVLLVLGETGSGKTTQIPQFVLDDCCKNGEPCRIFCTQPRRFAAIAVAERIAEERGESVGQTVGYQVRLERRVSTKTCLTFCTTRVLLGTLMAGDASLTRVTHIIMDEVHERDGLMDFLLIKMRDMLQKMPKLKLILSSAAMDVGLFLRYFGNCPFITLKGRQFEVKELFLEDVLKLTGFIKTDRKKNKGDDQSRAEGCEAAGERSTGEGGSSLVPAAQSLLQDRVDSSSQQRDCSEQVDTWLQREMDSSIFRLFISKGRETAFTQLLNLIVDKGVNVNYRHSENGWTALMVTAMRGAVSPMVRLLNMGADINAKDFNGWTALKFAEHYQQTDTAHILRSLIPAGDVDVAMSSLVLDGEAVLHPEEQNLLRLYHHSFGDEQVDLDLIMDLLHHICSTTAEGAVLIFLPGYEEIVSLRDRFLYDDKRFIIHSDRYQVFTLHSDMQPSDQKNVMMTSPSGVRKIILSTNVAETSITINDVVFVIDSGKVNEKSYDTFSRVSTLRTVWISQASTLQRKGRAGRCRPGVCFHLFSRLHFRNMLEFQVPQLLRMQLQDLCLQTKLLASCPVAEFLSQAPQPPPAYAIGNTVNFLKKIDVMDQFENLTDLGYLLADLPMEAQLRKMVLCAVVLKCLDPVLTITCMLAYRDPFILPAQSSQKQAVLQCRSNFTANSLSDHMALLRVFQAWQEAHIKGQGRSFCEKNFLSQGTMEMILGIRVQLIGQLRAMGLIRVRGHGGISYLNCNSDNWAVVKAALVAGMFPNVAHMRQNSLPFSSSGKKLIFHPRSILSSAYNKVPPQIEWLIYDEMTQGDRVASVRCCSVVTSITVAIFGGSSRLPDSTLQKPDKPLGESSNGGTKELVEIKIDEGIVFWLDAEAAGLVFDLRQKWQSLFLRRIRGSSKHCDQDEAIIQALVFVLSAEEQEAGLQQPTGVGQRPRVMTLEDGTQSSKNPKSASQPPPNNSHDRSSRTAASGCPQMESDKREEAQMCDLTSCCGSSSNFSLFVFGQEFFSQSLKMEGFSSMRYFFMKSSKLEHIKISQKKGIWYTTSSIEAKLSLAFMNSGTVILFFSAQESEHFQGCARMMSPVTSLSSENFQGWGQVGLGSEFNVDWIHRERVPFHHSQHIRNLWNDNLKVCSSRDGQELEPHAGRQLLLLWERKDEVQ